MAQPKLQILRTETPNQLTPPLDPGELAVEMAHPRRLWVGVPTSIDPAGKIALIDEGPREQVPRLPMDDPSHWDWAGADNYDLTVAVSTVIGFPTGEQPGTHRSILVKGVDATELAVYFDARFESTHPVIPNVTDANWWRIEFYCPKVGSVIVTAIQVAGERPAEVPQQAEMTDPARWDWGTALNFDLRTSVAPVIGVPSGGQTGESRTILVRGVDDSPLTVRFDAAFGPIEEVPGVTESAWCLVRLYCVVAGMFAVTATLVGASVPETPEDGALTDPGHWSWSAGKNLELITAVSPEIAAPEGGESGEVRTILVKGVDDSPLTVRFDVALGPVPAVAGVTDTAWCFVRFYCVAAGAYAVTASLIGEAPGTAEQAAMTDPNHWDWNAAKRFELVAAVGPVIAAPRGSVAGEHRTILVKGVDDSPLMVTFDAAFGPASPVIADVSAKTWYAIDVLCVTPGSFLATTSLVKSDPTPVEIIDPSYWDWRTAINRELTVQVNAVIAGPAHAQAGTQRNIVVRSADGTPRRITFDSSFIGAVPAIEVSDERRLEIFCISPSANSVR